MPERHARFPQRQKAAKDHERDEQSVDEQHEVGKEAIGHLEKS
jgi:hypothetical protein